MSTAAPAGTQRWSFAIRAAFIAGDMRHATEIVDDASRELDPVAVLDDVIAPAMREVGELWASNLISVADEHLATATAHWLISRIAGEFVPPRMGRGDALLVALPSERHTTGLLMAELVLFSAGYHVRNLGAGVPLDDLAGMVARDQPEVVGLAAALATHCHELAPTVEAVAAVAPEARIVVGGAAVPAAFTHPRAERVEDMRALAALVATG